MLWFTVKTEEYSQRAKNNWIHSISNQFSANKQQTLNLNSNEYMMSTEWTRLEPDPHVYIRIL